MELSSSPSLSLYNQKRQSIDVDVDMEKNNGITIGNDKFAVQRDIVNSALYINDYDAQNEKFDYRSSKTAFDKPYFRISSQINTNALRYRLSYLTPEHSNFTMEISRIVLNNLCRDSIRSHIKFVDAVRITNPVMHEQCLQYQSILMQQRAPKDFTFLFMDMGGFDPERESRIFNEGLPCGNVPLDCLGDSRYGVYLSTSMDACTVSPLIPFVPHRFIIFKVLLGNIRNLPFHDFSDPPKVEYEKGVHSHTTRATKLHGLPHYNFYNSLVYMFDKVDDYTFNEYPRSIYPYAAVTLYLNNFYRGLTQLRLPYLPKNEIGSYTLSFGKLKAIKCKAYALHDRKSNLTEVTVRGIQVQKIISMISLGKAFAIRKFLLGCAGSFLNRAYLKLWSNQTSPPTEYFLKHTVISSTDPAFINIVKRLQMDNQALVFAVPWLPLFTRSEDPANNDFGFCVPNSSMSSLLGIPYFAADVLHVFVLSKVLMNTLTHPLKTIIREEILMELNGRMTRSDKISDNDIRTALSLMGPPMTVNVVGDSKLGEKNGTETPPVEPMEVDKPDLSPTEAEPSKVPDEKPVVSNIKAEEVSAADVTESTLYENPEFKTLVIINPCDVREEQIDPTDLEKILTLSNTRSNKRINSKMTIIYHYSMKAANLAQTVKSGEYLQKCQEIEQKFSESDLIEYCDPHICDRGRLSHRALLVCLLTLKRKKAFDNAVIVTRAPITQEDVDTFKIHKICLVDPKIFVKHLETGNNLFLL